MEVEWPYGHCLCCLCRVRLTQTPPYHQNIIHQTTLYKWQPRRQLYQPCKWHDHDHQWENLVLTLLTKGSVNINLLDLCETLIIYILLSIFQLVHMVLTIKKHDVRRFITSIESAHWNPWDNTVKVTIRCLYSCNKSLTRSVYSQCHVDLL